MRREMTGKAARREIDRASQVLGRHPLPNGIRQFELETDEDQDGDPVMWIWLDSEDDSSNWSTERREALADFLAEITRELYEVLEEYWPHFRFRTVKSKAPAPSAP
jgi:hypothetical protein